jgi:hypothetical protein
MRLTESKHLVAILGQSPSCFVALISCSQIISYTLRPSTCLTHIVVAEICNLIFLTDVWGCVLFLQNHLALILSFAFLNRIE